MADNQQYGAEHQHCGGFTFVVDIVAEDRSDGHSQQREHCEDCLGGATHVTHKAVANQSYHGQSHQAEFQTFIFGEIACKRADSHDKHYDVLNDGYGNREGIGATAPIGGGVGFDEGEVALEHIHGVFLEGEDGAVVKHAEQSHEPKSETGENLAKVADFERIVLLFGLAGLFVEFSVHKEIDDEHHKGDAQQHHTEFNGVVHMDVAAKFCEIG